MLKKKKWFWLLEGVLVAAFAAVLFMSCYGTFERRANEYAENPIESEENINWLYSNNQLLYRDLYNKQNQTQKDYISLYYGLSQELQNVDPNDVQTYLEESLPEEIKSDQAMLYEIYQMVQEGYEGIRSYFEELEGEFSDLNAVYDYMIQDTSTGTVITNSGKTELDAKDYYFYLTFRYDEKGNVTVDYAQGDDSELIRKYANAFIRPGNGLPSDQGVFSSRYGHSAYAEYIDDYTLRNYPVNCKITYAMSFDTLEAIRKDDINIGRYNGSYFDTYRGFVNAGCGRAYMYFAFAVFLCGIFLPIPGKCKPWELSRLCRLPLELLIWIPIFVMGMGSNVVSIAVSIATDQAANNIAGYLISMSAAGMIVNLADLLLLTFLYTLMWYTGTSVRECREAGIWGYMKRRCMIYRFFPFIKRKIKGFYHELTHIDITGDARKMIIKIVLVNGVILFIISTMWVAGFPVTVIYSVLLYFILKKYVSNLQKKYEILLNATNEIAQGNLNVTIHEDLGVFEPFRPEITRIQKGFKKAVEEEVKSQKMKAELITNVSHDLKTPLTAIITYIGLLKDDKITQEQRKEYLDTLERKSLRLKVLIEDLFEISKATSKTVKLEIVDVDIMNLIKQAQLEMSDKLEAAGLEVKMLLPNEKIILPLDSQKTFRIYENLFGNVAKYALHGTRVYVTGTATEEAVTITLKNISAQEIQVNPEELTDRFVRGDVSRNTEGSGLGLAIAKSFTELQNGKLTLDVDGDLFKVTTIWRRKR